MPVILATQEAAIRRIMVQSQPRQTVCKTLSRKKQNKTKQKKPSQKRAGRVAQGIGPEFKLQYRQKKKLHNKYRG
jgi:ABC-type transporter MlaC component